jgi:hypothetical protein
LPFGPQILHLGIRHHVIARPDAQQRFAPRPTWQSQPTAKYANHAKKISHHGEPEDTEIRTLNPQKSSSFSVPSVASVVHDSFFSFTTKDAERHRGFPHLPGLPAGLCLIAYHLSLITFRLALRHSLFYNQQRISRPHHRPARIERQPVRPVGDFE